MDKINKEGGQWFKPDHFILALGRTTPSIMHAFTKAPTNGWIISGYGDYRIVRPSRVAGWAVKRPSVALQKVLEQYAMGSTFAQIFGEGPLTFGLKDGAVGMGDYVEYNKYNKNGDDIAEQIEYASQLIVTDELDYDY
jgi:hypothetical protein